MSECSSPAIPDVNCRSSGVEGSRGQGGAQNPNKSLSGGITPSGNCYSKV